MESHCGLRLIIHFLVLLILVISLGRGLDFISYSYWWNFLYYIVLFFILSFRVP